MKRAFILIITAAFLASCAPRETVRQPIAGEEPIPPAVRALKLPDLKEKKEEPAKKEAEAKQPAPAPVVVKDYAEVEDGGQYIVLNFDGADIQTVIATFGELLGINYIMGPNISGSVTIQSYKKFPTRDLFHIFQTILELNGLTATKDGALYRIVPIDQVRQHPGDIEKGKDVKYRLDSSFVTQLMPLDYVKATEIRGILNSFRPRGSEIIIYEPANLLIITALPATLSKFIKIIQSIDVPDIEKEAVKTFVYYVEHGEAKKLADKIQEIYPRKSKTAAAAPRVLATRKTTTSRISSTAALPGELGEITVTAYEDINAIIIKTDPRSYIAILELLKKIDIPVKQVLIEVLVMEVNLDDSTELGVEWIIKSSRGNVLGIGSFTDNPPNVDVIDGVITAKRTAGKFSTFVTGLIGSSIYSTVINTIAAKSSFNLLASPHILAMDNKEASIHIGDEVPIATGFNQQPATAGATSTLISAGQIQYKNIGIKLKVTPHITENNRVSLKISQEVSALGADVLIAGKAYPAFTTRTAQTSAVVESGHTLVIGGMIREELRRTKSGIPILGDLPVLGYLFSKTTNKKNKVELIVTVTPHVISSQDEADDLTESFMNKVRVIKKRLEEREAEAEEELSENDKKSSGGKTPVKKDKYKVKVSGSAVALPITVDDDPQHE